MFVQGSGRVQGNLGNPQLDGEFNVNEICISSRVNKGGQCLWTIQKEKLGVDKWSSSWGDFLHPAQQYISLYC